MSRNINDLRVDNINKHVPGAKIAHRLFILLDKINLIGPASNVIYVFEALHISTKYSRPNNESE
jgi:hypothetical protein